LCICVNILRIISLISTVL